MGRQIKKDELGNIRGRRDKWFAEGKAASEAETFHRGGLKQATESRIGAFNRWQELNDLLAELDPEGEEAQNLKRAQTAEEGKEGEKLPDSAEDFQELPEESSEPPKKAPPPKKKVSTKK